MVKFSFLICRSEFVCFSFFFNSRSFSVTSREIFPAIQFVSDSLIGQNISNLWNACMVNHSRQSICSRFPITRDVLQRSLNASNEDSGESAFFAQDRLSLRFSTMRYKDLLYLTLVGGGGGGGGG